MPNIKYLSPLVKDRGATYVHFYNLAYGYCLIFIYENLTRILFKGISLVNRAFELIHCTAQKGETE